VYLVDTDVIGEARKGARANSGVRKFFADAGAEQTAVFLSVVTIGELRRGVEMIRYRGDARQARRLEHWLTTVLDQHGDAVLDIDSEIAQVWGTLRVPRHENALDKLIAATALIHDLTVVTRNEDHFAGTGVRSLNPFS
jgi:hypothetical protein